MNIAELVLNLGVKGTDKTTSALGGVKQSLKETSSMALETKVALAAALYALERLFAASGQRGTDLENFSTLTGVTVQRLQQYQYAARQVGASNEEMEGTFKSLQAAMADVQYGGAPPAGIAHVADVLGIEIGEKEIEDFKKQPEKLLQILQQYAAKEKDIGLRNKTLGSFPGVTDNVKTGLIKGVFNEQNLAKAPVYNEGQTKALNKNNIAVQNLKNDIEMEIGKIYAKHGGEIIDDISRIIHEVITLGQAFGDLAEKMGLFSKLTPMAIEGWTQIIQAITALVNVTSKKGVKDTLKDFIFGSKEEQEAWQRQQDAEKALKGKIKANSAKGVAPPKGYTPEGDLESDTAAYTLPKKVAAPVIIPAIAPTKVATPVVLPIVNNTANTQQVNVNQTLNFNHDGTNAQKVGSDHRKAANEAYRQMPQGQVK